MDANIKVKSVQFIFIGNNYLYDTGAIQGICSKYQYEYFKEGKIEKYQLYEYSPKDS